MIKEYFTDGLIGLAILLSLFRTDLDIVNINNLFSYPEVQDIIQGQTAAYLPSNFHHVRNMPLAYGNSKHLDNDIFAAWYNNFNIENLPNFRGIRRNDIEAFLVSGSAVVGAHIQDVSTTNPIIPESNASPSIQSPTLPVEGANSFSEQLVSNNASLESQEIANGSTTTEEPTIAVDVTFLFNNPFPGCNLTSEDLELIDVLWRQDEDLGVGKEVFDTNLRLEMEKKQEMEQLRLQELHKAQLLAKEKEEREKQEQADRWLKENFRRDGETGEWVSLQNNSEFDINGVDTFNASQPSSANEDLSSLASAWDYIFNSSSELLGQDSAGVQQEQATSLPDLSQNIQTTEQTVLQTSAQQPAPLPMQQPDNGLEDDWASLETYLNAMNNSEVVEQTLISPVNTNCTSTSNNVTASLVPDFFLVDDNVVNNNNMSAVDSLTVSTNHSMPMFDPSVPAGVVDTGDVAPQSYILNNVSMPANNINMTAELMSLTSASELADRVCQNMTDHQTQASPLSSLSNTAVNFDLGQLDFFDDLAGLEGAEMPNEDLGMAEIDEMFRSIQSSGAELLEPILDLGHNMDTLQRLGEEINNEDFDDLGMLEGAIGGSVDNYTSFNQGSSTGSGGDYNSLKGQQQGSGASTGRHKFQRHSESSNDSGYAYKGNFSSSNSSNGSSYSGSPAGSAHGLAEGGSNNNHSYFSGFEHHSSDTGVMLLNGNVTSLTNGSEHDPHSSRTTTLAQHQVAHNHTYNTPPGQVPREVKKYAQKEPSKKGPQSRDQRRADELKIPFTLEEIIEWPVETFNEMLNSHKLSEMQLTLIRDIRRRGKNKVAAQNCRKRKVSAIVNLSDERSDLEITRDRLLAERAQMELETRRMRAKFGQLYTHIFQSLRDEHGQPYDPSRYSLQHSSDGNVFLVPRNTTSAGGANATVASVGGGGSAGSSATPSAASSPSTSTASASSSNSSLSASKKRKSCDE